MPSAQAGRRLIRTTLIAALAATALATTSTSANAATLIPVTNPSFIQPYVDPASDRDFVRVGVGSNAIPGWRVVLGSVDVFGRQVSRTTDGSQAIDLGGSERGGIEQTIATEKDATENVTFKVKINDHPDCVAGARTVEQNFHVQFAADPAGAVSFRLGTVEAPGRNATWNLRRATLYGTDRFSRLQFISDPPRLRPPDHRHQGHRGLGRLRKVGGSLVRSSLGRTVLS
ncbi:DUF642 domain-containing protein [Streptomyces sp. NPDC001594]|uniref:DUF642 domain-containing protein n=1 Tax=Streptomyces sp. NPDC001594 TaxID=3364590 RepID=UPI0036C535D9